MSLSSFATIDAQLTRWMARHGPVLVRIALGIVFFWFGIIKFVPGLSPADDLAVRTISALTFGHIGPSISRPVLAAWETLIGLGLLTGMFLRAVLLLMIVQMLGTLTPLVLFPAETWHRFPVALTLEGQYIVKNLVLVAAAVVIGATVRGGAMVASPHAAARAKAEEARESGSGAPSTKLS